MNNRSNQLEPDRRCNKCSSPRVLLVQIDSETYVGNISRVNGDSYYESSDTSNYEDRPDIWIYHCCACGKQEG